MAFRLCVYLVGYEREPFEKIWANLLAWFGLWPFIFPTDWHWHVLMITEDEFYRYQDKWRIGGTPKWSELPSQYRPSMTPEGRFCSMSGVWFAFARWLSIGESRPGVAVQRLHNLDNMLPPNTFYHEMSHALGADTGGTQADYNTIHFDHLYHCGSLYRVAGDCTQMDGQAGTNPCMGTMCVRCRVIAGRWTGQAVNVRQTQQEYEWLKRTFKRQPDCCWPNSDVNRQMANVYGYDYEKYPLVYWSWEHNLAWYYSHSQTYNNGLVHVHLERLIGGDGLPRVVVTGEHPDYVFDPVEVSVKEKGFLRVTPDPAVAGSPVEIYAYALRDGSEVPIPGVTVRWGGEEVGETGEDGKVTYVPTI